ncbi:MAG: invasion associated locus B family protein [Beijerinckiaceae bacterium]|jgi:invasion protein IalB|nr:invasion associated locus B family protein [Beijerinckiaceae bacterium]
MINVRIGLGIAACLASLTLTTGVVFAQAAKKEAAPAQPPGPNRVELKAMQQRWTKVCGKDPGAKQEICYTTRDFGQNENQPPVMAVAVYDPKGVKTKIVRLLLPVGLLLQAGFRFSVDKSATQDGQFEICFPNGCFAQAKIDARALSRLKRGKDMNVFVKNQVGAEVAFVVPLTGFGKAFDGPPIDPKVLQAEQEALKKQLEKRAEEQRKKLEADSKK